MRVPAGSPLEEGIENESKSEETGSESTGLFNSPLLYTGLLNIATGITFTAMAIGMLSNEHDNIEKYSVLHPYDILVTLGALTSYFSGTIALYEHFKQKR